MYTSIFVPVDMGHLDHLGKALKTAGDLARHYGIPVVYGGATTPQPTREAHTPEEFGKKLEAFAAEQAGEHGITASAKTIITHDPAVDLSERLIDGIRESGADLVVMASHKPGMAEHIFASHAGWVASHSSVSVFVVR